MFNNTLRPTTTLPSSSTTDWTLANVPFIPLTINYKRANVLKHALNTLLVFLFFLSHWGSNGWFLSCLGSKLYLLGQFCWLQLTLSARSPLHTPPYFSRTDFVLVFSLVPPPQVNEQAPTAHSLHWQLTKINWSLHLVLRTWCVLLYMA